MPQDERYVLFMVPTDRLQLSEIEAQGLCNEELFKRMREEYYRTKGWFRRWFGLMRFSHCEFYKVGSFPLLFPVMHNPTVAKRFNNY